MRRLLSFRETRAALSAANRRSALPAPGPTALGHVRQVYNALGTPLAGIPTLHVAGTNGKGSVCFKAAKVLETLGLRTGLFVSPHLSSIRERAQVNGELISELDFVSLFHIVNNTAEQQGVPLSEFEFLFLMSALHFRAQAVDALVLEVGCGGDHDATNVVTDTVAILTSVGLDHTRFLGTTVEKIADHKARIFKSGWPAIAGKNVPLETVRSVAQEVGAKFEDFSQWTRQEEQVLSSLGLDPTVIDVDEQNACLAVAGIRRLFPSLNLLDNASAVRNAVTKRAPCRWEIFEVSRQADNLQPLPVILDMGHNPDAIQVLIDRAAREYPGYTIHLIYGMARDKDALKCLQKIITYISPENIHFVQSQNFRALSPEQLQALLGEATGSDVAGRTTFDATTALQTAISEARQEKSLILVCGTGYVMPPIRAALGVQEPRDDI